jgi:hypothetical protein
MSSCIFSGRPRPSAKVNEFWETAKGPLKIRVTAYAEENGGFVGGAYYVFQSAKVGSDDWSEIMTFRHDDPVPIPRDQVRFSNDQIAYLFMGWMFAVTIDGGQSWTVWNATKDLPHWQCCNYRLIQDVTIAVDGTGLMKLNPIPDRRGEVAELHTTDYGHTWGIE